MALVLADRVRESTLTTGTGTVTLVGPVTGYQTFAVIGNGNTTYYTISNPNGTEWEVGIGTYTAASKTLSRDTVLSSSNGGAKTSFSVGSKDVFVSYPAEKSINQDEVGNTFVPNLGATTPSSGVFTTLTGNSTSQFGRSSANYFQAVGAAANLSPEISVQGSDASIPFTIESKGTGAVNLVPGSRGVNVSNGQTVTAITRTAVGQSYTSVPTMTISAPTTAGGVQATATVASMGINFVTIASGGTGYAVNDEVLIVGGSFTTQARYRITGVSGGVVTTVLAIASPVYQSLPTNPASTTAVIGTGSGLTLTVDWAVTAYTITNAGSGYVEQPTVTFSGGGGSGAAAYATIGAVPKIQSLASAMSFFTAGGEQVRITDGAATTSYLAFRGSATANPGISVVGSGTTNLDFSTQGSASLRFFTNTYSQEQFRVSHTASAVNYVQVTGAATTARPAFSAQGSDTNIGLYYVTKGTGSHRFDSRGGAGVNFLIIDNGSASTNVNYTAVTGSPTSFAPVFSVGGSDTNIAATFQSKGTGAINLAPGSSGVNVSNGGTVTAITRTATGTGYTSIPTVTISAPTTAGGVQATATCTMGIGSASIAGGGTGYTAGDTLTIVGGTFFAAATLTVNTVSSGVITSVSVATGGSSYSVLPTNPVSVTGGTGSGATFNLSNYFVSVAFTITNAGSGYVEQPTVSFSGGGGSGAAAYATVGSGTTVRTLGSTMDFFTPAGRQFQVSEQFSSGSVPVNYIQVSGRGTGSGPTIGVQGSDTNIAMFYVAKGTGGHTFTTGGGAVNQLIVSHTASAVNYVQVTGAATGSGPIVSAQGSDANVALVLDTKGTGSMFMRGGGTTQFRVRRTASSVNYASVTGATSGNAPVFEVEGTDTNIDLALTPKGTGRVRFGTHTATADTAISGYIEILDSGGTVRRLAVIT